MEQIAPLLTKQMNKQKMCTADLIKTYLGAWLSKV